MKICISFDEKINVGHSLSVKIIMLDECKFSLLFNQSVNRVLLKHTLIFQELFYENALNYF